MVPAVIDEQQAIPLDNGNGNENAFGADEDFFSSAAPASAPAGGSAGGGATLVSAQSCDVYEQHEKMMPVQVL